MARARRNQARARRDVVANQIPDVLFFRFAGYDCSSQQLVRLRVGSINLQSLRTRPGQELAVSNFAFTCAEWRFDCHIFDRRGRLSGNGLALSGLCELPPGDTGTGSCRREFTIRNSGLETSQADVGAFCCAEV